MKLLTFFLRATAGRAFSGEVGSRGAVSPRLGRSVGLERGDSVQPADLQPLGLCIRTATGLAKVADLSARIPKVSGSEAATRFGGPAVHRVTKTIWEMKWDHVVAPLSAPSPSCLL